MSETVLNVPLSELTAIRILCQGQDGRACAGVVELSIEAMIEMYKGQKCPLCKIDITDTSPDHVARLGEAICGLKRHKGVKIEFVIPLND